MHALPVNIFRLVLGTCPGLGICHRQKTYDAAKEYKFWLKVFNLSVNKALFAAGQELGTIRHQIFLIKQTSILSL